MMTDTLSAIYSEVNPDFFDIYRSEGGFTSYGRREPERVDIRCPRRIVSGYALFRELDRLPACSQLSILPASQFVNVCERYDTQEVVRADMRVQKIARLSDTASLVTLVWSIQRECMDTDPPTMELCHLERHVLTLNNVIQTGNAFVFVTRKLEEWLDGHPGVLREPIEEA